MIDVPTPDTDQTPDTDTRDNSKTKSSTTFFKHFYRLCNSLVIYINGLSISNTFIIYFLAKNHEKKSILELNIKYVGAGS